MVHAVIVAAGSSRRMGFDKLFADLDGRPVLARTVEVFAQCEAVDAVVVVTSADRVKNVRELEGVDAVVEGGAERHLSVWNGLRAIAEDCELVAVHDGARPLVTAGQISACIAAARNHGAAASARRITDTVKRADGNGCVTESIDRENLWAMETPQVFAADLLKDAYENAIADGLAVTDEVSAVEHAGGTVVLVENTAANPKITFEADLETARRLIQ